MHLHVRTPFPQMFRLLSLGNSWADCFEIWYALGDPLVTAYAVVTGGVSLHVRTCTVHTALLYLRNGSADCIQIWCVGWGFINYVLSTRYGLGISARAHVHTALLYLRNGLTDCVQTWYVGEGLVKAVSVALFLTKATSSDRGNLVLVIPCKTY